MHQGEFIIREDKEGEIDQIEIDQNNLQKIESYEEEDFIDSQESEDYEHCRIVTTSQS